MSAREAKTCEMCGMHTVDWEIVPLVTQGEIPVCIICGAHIRTGILAARIALLKLNRK